MATPSSTDPEFDPEGNPEDAPWVVDPDRFTISEIAGHVESAQSYVKTKEAEHAAAGEELAKARKMLAAQTVALYKKLGPAETASAEPEEEHDTPTPTPRKEIDLSKVAAFVNGQTGTVSGAQIAEELGYVTGTPFSSVLRDLSKGTKKIDVQIARDGTGPNTVYKALPKK